MSRNTVVVSIIFLLGAVVGFSLSQLQPLWIIFQIGVVVGVLTIVSLVIVSLSKKRTPSYDALSRELFEEINQDVKAIHGLICYVEQEDMCYQLEFICKDTLVLLNKVTEKLPESRLSTGKFIRGNLDFILHDILPQYIEMQETPRYYETPRKTMTEGRKAIDTFARFLNKQIANLEIADEMRYLVAIDMLKALDSYTQNQPVPEI